MQMLQRIATADRLRTAKNRLEELRQAYLEEGYFPQKELAMLDSPENTKGRGFLCSAEYIFPAGRGNDGGGTVGADRFPGEERL